jgi:hypothetical protein
MNMIRRGVSVIPTLFTLMWAHWVAASDLPHSGSLGQVALSGEVQAIDLFAQSFITRGDGPPVRNGADAAAADSADV